MTTATTLERVIDVVTRTFDASRRDLAAESSSLDVDGWDSVSHAILILDLEDEFGVTLDFGTALEADNLGKLAGYIDTLLGRA